MKKVLWRICVSLIFLSVFTYKYYLFSTVNAVNNNETYTDLSVIYEFDIYSAMDIENEIRYTVDENYRIEENNRLEQERKQRYENLLNQLNSGQFTYGQLYADTLIVGDSLINAMQRYKVLEQVNMISQVSANFNHLEENIGNIINNNPKNLILHYGINMAGNTENDLEIFIKKYTELINVIRANLPNTKIFVSGIFNVSLANRDRFPNIPLYNLRLAEMCRSLGISFIDNSTFLGDNEEYYGTDGIHAKKEFYLDIWVPHITYMLFY